MGLILPIVFLGLMASLSPATIVVFVLVLGTARARVNAAGFLVGWGLSLTLVFAGSYVLAASGASETDGGRIAVARSWRSCWAPPCSCSALGCGGAGRPPAVSTGRSRPGARTGSWSHMQRLTPTGAVVVGVLKQPWAITTAAALVVVHNQTTGLRRPRRLRPVHGRIDGDRRADVPLLRPQPR